MSVCPRLPSIILSARSSICPPIIETEEVVGDEVRLVKDGGDENKRGKTIEREREVLSVKFCLLLPSPTHALVSPTTHAQGEARRDGNEGRREERTSKWNRWEGGPKERVEGMRRD